MKRGIIFLLFFSFVTCILYGQQLSQKDLDSLYLGGWVGEKHSFMSGKKESSIVTIEKGKAGIVISIKEGDASPKQTVGYFDNGILFIFIGSMGMSPISAPTAINKDGDLVFVDTIYKKQK